MEPDLEAIKDRFMSLIRKSLNQQPIGFKMSVRQWATIVADAIEAIRDEYGDTEAEFCMELNKEIMSRMKHNR